MKKNNRNIFRIGIGDICMLIIVCEFSPLWV